MKLAASVLRLAEASGELPETVAGDLAVDRFVEELRTHAGTSECLPGLVGALLR